jgi:crossover junction endodeoxyribonuclease RuvC
MKVSGLDLSLRSTGIATVDTVARRANTLAVKTGKLNRGERLDMIVGEVLRTCRGTDLAVIEGPAFMSQSSSMHLINEMHGVVKHALWSERIPYAIVPPSTLKMYTTGKGGADKGLVIAAMAAAFPGVVIGGDDEADALALAAMGCAWGDAPVDAHVIRWKYELAKALWPDATGQAALLVRKTKPSKPAVK